MQIFERFTHKEEKNLCILENTLYKVFFPNCTVCTSFVCTFTKKKLNGAKQSCYTSIFLLAS